MPKPTSDESKEDFISKYMSSDEAKSSFPDEKQRYVIALNVWKKHKSKKAKVSGMKIENLEIQAALLDEEVTEEIAQEYGYSLEDIDQNGYHLVEFDLMLLDEPCTPSVEGKLAGKVKEFIFSSDGAEEYLSSLKNKPIHINDNFDGHFDLVKGEGQKKEKKYTVAGSFLGGRITTNDEAKKVVRCLAGLFDKSLPKQVEEIKASKEDLGASFELNPTAVEIDQDSLVATVKSWVFSGAAILKKSFAAFPETALLIARKGDDVMANKDLSAPMANMKKMLKAMGDIDMDDKDMEEMIKSMSGDELVAMNKARRMINNKMWELLGKNQTAEGEHGMDPKTYTQEEVDALKASTKKEVEDAIQAKATTDLAAKEKEITDLKTQIEASKTTLTDKDKVITDITNKITEISAKMLDSEIEAQVNTWWEENKKFYNEKDKITLISARKEILKGSAKTEQIDSLISARVAPTVEKTKVSLLGNGVLDGNGRDLDLAHGIRSKDGFKRY